MTQEPNPPIPSTQDIAERGHAIYEKKFRQEYEKTKAGKFVAINVNSAEATVGETSEEAVRLALKKDPDGLFHLERVGSPSAFEAGWFMSYARY